MSIYYKIVWLSYAIRPSGVLIRDVHCLVEILSDIHRNKKNG